MKEIKGLTKTKTIILLVSLFVFGSISTFFGCNLLMSDLSNMFYGVHDYYIVSSIPMTMINLDFTIAIHLIIRLYKHNDARKQLFKFYLILGIINSSIGIVTSILSGTIVYHSFFADSIFKGYSFIMLIINIILLVGCIFFLIKVKGLEEDLKPIKVTFGYVLYTIVFGILLYYSLNKFGGVLLSPMYINTRTLVLVLPLYIALCVPIFYFIYYLLKAMNAFKSKEQEAIMIITIAAVGVISTALTCIIGLNNTEFVSAVSILVPIERLGSMPLNAVFMFVASIVLAVYFLIRLKKTKRYGPTKN